MSGKYGNVPRESYRALRKASFRMRPHVLRCLVSESGRKLYLLDGRPLALRDHPELLRGSHIAPSAKLDLFVDTTIEVVEVSEERIDEFFGPPEVFRAGIPRQAFRTWLRGFWKK